MVFDAQWFKDNQKKLLVLANSKLGKQLLCIDYPGRIDAILPNAIFTVENNKVRAEFRTHNKYSKRLYHSFKSVWHLAHKWDEFVNLLSLPQYDLGFATLTAYSGEFGANDPIDGYVGRVAQDQTFAAIIAGAGNQNIDGNAFDNFVRVQASTTTNQFNSVNRPICGFLTSAIGASNNVDAGSVVYYFYIDGKQNAIGDIGVHIVSALPASSTDLVDADYGTLGSTSFASKTYAGVSTGGYSEFTLNTDGENNVNKTGHTYYGAKSDWDYSGVFSGSWVSNGESRFLGYYSEQTGTSRDPKLTLTYSLAAADYVPRNGFVNYVDPAAF